MKLTKSVAAAVAALVLALTAIRAGADAKPLRHLEYTFTYGVTSSTSADATSNVNSSINPGDVAESPTANGGSKGDSVGTGVRMPTSNGGSTSAHSAGDQGTIDVNVVALQPDGGLVVSIWEAARGTRSNPPATCVVYADTNVICDPDKAINEEEMTLLRFLGRGFVSSAAIDAKNHWNISDTSPSFSIDADYTIASTSGNTLHLDEHRMVTTNGINGGTSNTEGKIAYDSDRTIPVAIQTYTIDRSEPEVGRVSEQNIEIDLSLAADSMSRASSN